MYWHPYNVDTHAPSDGAWSTPKNVPLTQVHCRAKFGGSRSISMYVYIMGSLNSIHLLYFGRHA